MTTINLNELPLNEFIATSDPLQHCLATFPLLGMHGTKKLASVYFEIEPGEHLGTHTDSAEELLVILDGDLEVTAGKETTTISKRGLILVPEMMPHNLRNTGKEKARILGVFGGANNIVATFEKEWLPVHSNVVDSSLL